MFLQLQPRHPLPTTLPGGTKHGPQGRDSQVHLQPFAGSEEDLGLCGWDVKIAEMARSWMPNQRKVSFPYSSGNSGRRCGEEDRCTCQGCCGILWEGQPRLVCTGKAPRSTLKGTMAGIFQRDMSSLCLQQVFCDKRGQVAIPSSKGL